MMSLLDPKSVAIIGASATEGKVGHDVLNNLLTQGYEGDIYPINPKYDTILETKTYDSMAELPQAPDLAIIITPAKTVPALLEECAARGTKNIIIISAGFKEIGTDDGKQLETQVKQIANGHQLNILGPNCLGLLRPNLNLNASFAKDIPPQGGIALVSQSGAFAVALLDSAHKLHLGFSAVLSIGNKTVLDESDFVEMLAEDEKTTAIGLYLENIVDGTRFRKIVSKVTQKKPIVLIKSGVSSAGKKAASSHTGSLAGSDAAIQALCTQAGIHRARTLEEFTDMLRVLSTQPKLASNRIAIVTNAGGPGILAADATERAGLTLPALSERTETQLKEALPATASTLNPIDVIGDAKEDRFQAAFMACGEDPNIDGLCVLLTPQVMTPCEKVAQALVEMKDKFPLMPVVASFMGGETVQSARILLETNNIPVFDTPERAVASLSELYTSQISKAPALNIDTKRQQQAHILLQDTQGLLDEDSAKKLLELYSIPQPKQALATSAEKAAELAEQVGLPVVAKVSSPDIVHKTDVGGIRVDLKTPEEVAAAYTEIEASVKKNMPQAKWNGVLIQDMLPAGDEFIVGGLRDASFGPLIMVGLGGIYTELFKDTSFRLAPLTEKDAYTMLSELTSWKLLLGMRGQERRDIPELAELITNIGQLFLECPQITELDCNPVIISPEEAIIADAKIILGQ